MREQAIVWCRDKREILEVECERCRGAETEKERREKERMKEEGKELRRAEQEVEDVIHKQDPAKRMREQAEKERDAVDCDRREQFNTRRRGREGERERGREGEREVQANGR